ncbi:MAG: hypothetical protein GY906_18270 [bacterium]|nr:hypothetical protein [bacterium]
MRNLVIGLLTVVFPVASILHAAVVVKRYDGPLPEGQAAQQESLQDLPPAISTLDGQSKVENPTTFYIMPFFKIDSTSPTGETTFISVRNESPMVNTVTIQIFESGSAINPITVVNALLQKETWPINLRDETGTMTPDGDGFKRGWARILSASGPISADFFQIDFAQDFANGGRPIDIDGGGFCNQSTLRYLVGGGFTGGTVIYFMLDQPLGGDPMTDPPSVTGVLHRENGTVAGSFEVFTDNFSFEVNAADLIGDENFGSMDITFENAFSGGAAIASFDAFGRFSVSLESVCLDSMVP